MTDSEQHSALLPAGLRQRYRVSAGTVGRFYGMCKESVCPCADANLCFLLSGNYLMEHR